jgi:hypothetical protein
MSTWAPTSGAQFPARRAETAKVSARGVPRGSADLVEEALGAESGAEVGAVVPEVVGEVHPRHAAPAELALEPGAAGESGLQRGGEAGQATSTLSGCLRVCRECGVLNTTAREWQSLFGPRPGFQ